MTPGPAARRPWTTAEVRGRRRRSGREPLANSPGRRRDPARTAIAASGLQGASRLTMRSRHRRHRCRHCPRGDRRPPVPPRRRRAGRQNSASRLQPDDRRGRVRRPGASRSRNRAQGRSPRLRPTFLSRIRQRLSPSGMSRCQMRLRKPQRITGARPALRYWPGPSFWPRRHSARAMARRSRSGAPGFRRVS